MKRPAPCRDAVGWVKKRVGAAAFAPFTGQDFRAFAAFVHLVDLYLCSDGEARWAAVEAMRAVLRAMQPHCRPVAKAAIPFLGDWGHEDEIWRQVQ